jgi:hypothetical protein
MDEAVYMRSVEQAAELAGGYEELARRLQVPTEDVIDWSRGKDKPGVDVFLLMLDLIMDETHKLSRAATAFGLAEQVLAKAARSSKAG